MKFAALILGAVGLVGCAIVVDDTSPPGPTFTDVNPATPNDKVVPGDGISGWPLVPCDTWEDCPQPESSSCREVYCDRGGQVTDPGMPTGCYTLPSAPGTDCSFHKGEFTCPGNCSGSAPTYDCQPLEPHCGGY